MLEDEWVNEEKHKPSDEESKERSERMSDDFHEDLHEDKGGVSNDCVDIGQVP
jgi:hypothetical protein